MRSARRHADPPIHPERTDRPPTRRYFQDDKFVSYLSYLQYWKRPEYVKFIVYPHCLYFLDQLQVLAFPSPIPALSPPLLGPTHASPPPLPSPARGGAHLPARQQGLCPRGRRPAVLPLALPPPRPPRPREQFSRTRCLRQRLGWHPPTGWPCSARNLHPSRLISSSPALLVWAPVTPRGPCPPPPLLLLPFRMMPLPRLTSAPTPPGSLKPSARSVLSAWTWSLACSSLSSSSSTASSGARPPSTAAPSTSAACA